VLLALTTSLSRVVRVVVLILRVAAVLVVLEQGQDYL